ncbi:Protein of uncharacterised function (DUF2889) [Mycolicibacterium fortuitum]|jgi:hypothetical protein|uniref:Protein of uncharacterized function (DUF2889) n=2 Tax=Mycobacteriaceae TaxID=1762 RepID=A0A378WF06_MYCFO|nr:DUF2889 domain-containing protein [Mycolicibacterium fortuitum]SUA31352.1 Protein of uncharacterised function (DUF2889) [Mycolicibacterium fortuitum]
MTRDTGALDPVYLAGRARDIWTDDAGAVTEIGSAGLSATVELVARVVRHVEVTPPVAAVARLSGAPAMSGFRATADMAAPELRRTRDLRYALLDDVPVATLISGHALSASGLLGDVRSSGYLPVADQCAGFAAGGLLMTSFEAGDPVVVTGPQAPDLDHSDDPYAWHQVSPLPRYGMRRRRRVDVFEETPERIGIDAMFRDTYVRGDDLETIIHEYTLTATVDAATGVIVDSHATPRVLPWQECPGAVASAERITGMTLRDLHFRVRQELFGTSTCTHLNDLLRSVADVAVLMERVRGA